MHPQDVPWYQDLLSEEGCEHPSLHEQTERGARVRKWYCVECGAVITEPRRQADG